MNPEWRLGVALVAALAATQLAPPLLVGPDGELLPFTSEEHVLEFLRSAEISDPEELDVGVTRPIKVVLQLGAVRTHGIFRAVDERHARARWASQRGELFFRDRGLFECAAYELARLLGLDHIPPVIERRWERRTGSLQLWIEGTITEAERAQQGRFDPATARWNGQLGLMNVFDALIGNVDRNKGNLLIDSTWRLWFIDHTRAFSGSSQISLAALNAIERPLWQALQQAEDSQITATVERYLTARELRALLQRRRLLVAHFEQLIQDRGEARVVDSF